MFSVTEYEKVVCWKRAYYMYLSEAMPTASDHLVEQAGDPTFLSENNTVEALTDEMIQLVSIYWKLISDLTPCLGNQTLDRFRNLVFENSSFPFNADELIGYCKRRLLQENFSEAELNGFIEDLIEENPEDIPTTVGKKFPSSSRS